MLVNIFNKGKSMFQNIFGKNEQKISAVYDRKIANLFNTPEGKDILIYLIKINMVDIDPMNIKVGHIDLAYMAGRNDFLRLLVKISNFDFSEHIAESNGLILEENN